PKEYRDAVLKQTEFRLTPSPLDLLPETIFISPKLRHTGIYGATIKPLAFGIGMGGGGAGTARFDLDAGLVFTAAYLYSDTLPNTFFARPGLALTAELEFMTSDAFGISIGWESAVYIPPRLGPLFEVTPTERT